MLRFYSLTLIFLITFPILGYSSNEKYKEFMVEKQKLECLYEEIDNLLDEKGDPVWVLLRNQCTLKNKEKTRLDLPEPTKPKPKISDNPSISEKDILRLSKNQLRCFKKNYFELMKQDGDAVRVRFVDDCITSK